MVSCFCLVIHLPYSYVVLRGTGTIAKPVLCENKGKIGFVDDTHEIHQYP